MARAAAAATKLQNISKTGKVAESIAKIKHTAKFAEDTVKAAAAKSANIKMQSNEEQKRLPLREVVADCVKRWFQDSLKEAKAGDIGMQVLVGQMYYSGYGVPRDVQKGKAWFKKASKARSSVLNLRDKQPGFNASESDSDDQNVTSR